MAAPCNEPSWAFHRMTASDESDTNSTESARAGIGFAALRPAA